MCKMNIVIQNSKECTKFIKRMVIEMKKTVSMLLAILIAAISLCTLATSAFAETTTATATTTEFTPENPTDSRLTTTAASTTATTKVTTTATTAAPTTTTTTTAGTTATTAEAATTTEVSTTDEVATRKPGETYIDDSDETTKAPTTKKPAKVESVIPSTGSSIAVPAIALLALAASTVAVIKSKKDN